MSTRRRRQPRRTQSRPDPAEAIDWWLRIVALRTEWRQHALCTAPADRSAAEAAIVDLYALLDRPPPTFVWVGSPGAAVSVVPPSTMTLASDGPWPLESLLASRLSSLRHRLDERTGERPRHVFFTTRPTSNPEPLAALCSGEPLKSIVDRTVYPSLHGTPT